MAFDDIDPAIDRPFKNHSVAPHLALVAVQLMFGTWPILGKVALRVIPSTSLVAFRVGGAALAFLLLQRRLSQLWRLPRNDLAWLLLCTLLGVVINQFLFVKGLSLTTVINATLIGTTIPAFTLAVSIALGHDGLSTRRFLGILLAASGVVYLVDPFSASFSSQTTLGDLLILTTSLLYGAYIAISKDLLKRYGALNVITWIFLLASVVSVPVGALVFPREALKTAGPTLWLTVLYIIVVPTVAAYYLNAWALTRVTPSTVAIYIYLQPLIALGLAPWLLGEKWNSRTLLSSFLIFLGVGIVTRRGRSSAAREVAEHPDALAH